MRKLLVAMVGMYVSLVWGQTPQIAPLADWLSARPGFTVSVSPAPEAGVFLVRATVTDLETSKTLATPEVTTTAGRPATVEVGVEGRVMVKIVVTVEPSGRAASYVAQVRRDGRLDSQHEARLVLPDRT